MDTTGTEIVDTGSCSLPETGWKAVYKKPLVINKAVDRKTKTHTVMTALVPCNAENPYLIIDNISFIDRDITRWEIMNLD